MFKKIKLDRIYETVNYVESGFWKDGKMITSESLNEVDNIPAFEKIAEESINNLRKEGFAVERVDPKKANCIIRVFRHESYPYEDYCYWAYGTDVYIKTSVGLKSVRNTFIDYSEFAVTKWLFQDECFDIKPHFVDYYVKIS